VNFAESTLHLGGRIDGTAGLIKRGPGVLTLTANNSYLGATEIEGGTLAKGAAGDIIPDASHVIVGSQGTFALNGHDEITGALTVVGKVDLGNGTLTLQGPLAMIGGDIDVGSGRLAMGGDLTAISSATRTASITGAGRLDLGGVDRIFAVHRGGQATDLQILAVIHGAGFEGVTKTGAGELHFGNDNTFRGITKVADGWLSLHSPSTNKSLSGLLVIGDGEGLPGSAGVRSVVSGENLSSNFAIAVVADGWLALNHLSETIGPLTIHDGYVTTGSATLTVDGLVTMRGGTIDMASAGTLRLGGDVSAISSSLRSAEIISSFNGGTVSLNGATRTFTVDDGPLGIDLRINVPVSGAAGLTKSGPGLLDLQTDSTYTGSTTVNEGTVSFFWVNCIPGELIIGDGAGNEGTARVVAFAAGNNINDTAAVTIKSDGLLDLNDRPETIGALTILGGEADIGHGTLTINGALILDDAFINLDDHGELVLGGALLASSTSGNRSSIGNGSGGVLSLAGGIRVVAVATASLLTIEAVIVDGGGPGSLNITGPGTLELEADNTYSGVTAIHGGLVIVGRDSALGLADGTAGAGTVVHANATLRLRSVAVGNEALTLDNSILESWVAGSSWGGKITLASTATFAGPAHLLLQGEISGPGGLSKTLASVLTLDGANSYAGATVIHQGILYLRNSQALGLADGTAASGTTVLDGASLGLIQVSVANEALVLNGPGFGGLVFGALYPEGTCSWAGDVTLASASVIKGSGHFTLSGNITGAGPLTNAVNGTLVLTGTGSYTGPTTVDAATLQVNGSLTSAVTVNGNATLAGTGTVGAVIMNDAGTLSPGVSPGVLRSGNVELRADSTFRAELNGAVAGSGYDQLQVSGTVNLGGSTLNASLGFTPALDALFTLIANDGSDAVLGTFKDLPEGASLTLGTDVFRVSYKGGDGNDVVLTRPTPPARAITAQLVKKKVGGKVQLRVRVRFADTGAIKSEFKSPLKSPLYTKIRVSVMDSNGDGAADLIVITGKKNGRKVTRLRAG
jgi:autotransporter-associated beta strand protein